VQLDTNGSRSPFKFHKCQVGHPVGQSRGAAVYEPSGHEDQPADRGSRR